MLNRFSYKINTAKGYNNKQHDFIDGWYSPGGIYKHVCTNVIMINIYHDNDTDLEHGIYQIYPCIPEDT